MNSLVFFFVVAITNFGILAGTPYNKCVNVTNMDFL